MRLLLALLPLVSGTVTDAPRPALVLGKIAKANGLAATELQTASRSVFFAVSAPESGISLVPEKGLAELSEAEQAAVLARELASLELAKAKPSEARVTPIRDAWTDFDLSPTVGAWTHAHRLKAIPVAADYLRKAGYSPQALVTVFEAEQRHDRLVSLYQSWTAGPLSDLAKQAYGSLKPEELPMRRSLVSKRFRVAEEASGDGFAYSMFGREIFRLSAEEATKNPDMAAKLNAFFDGRPQPYEVQEHENGLLLGKDLQIKWTREPIDNSGAWRGVAGALAAYRMETLEWPAQQESVDDPLLHAFGIIGRTALFEQDYILTRISFGALTEYRLALRSDYNGVKTPMALNWRSVASVQGSSVPLVTVRLGTRTEGFRDYPGVAAAIERILAKERSDAISYTCRIEFSDDGSSAEALVSYYPLTPESHSLLACTLVEGKWVAKFYRPEISDRTKFSDPAQVLSLNGANDNG